jgi:hypothetical protein
MQLRHLTASIAVLSATDGAAAGYGRSKAESNAAPSGGSCVGDTRVTDSACAAGRSIA